MKDLFFWAAEYTYFSEIYNDNTIIKCSGFVEYDINLKANLIEEGNNIVKLVKMLVEREAADLSPERPRCININVTHISKLTNITR